MLILGEAVRGVREQQGVSIGVRSSAFVVCAEARSQPESPDEGRITCLGERPADAFKQLRISPCGGARIARCQLLDSPPGCDDKGTSSRQRPGEFNVLVLGAWARRIAPYLYAGRRVVVQGWLEMECWEMGEGPEHEAVCVLAERIHLAGDAPRSAHTREFAIPPGASDAPV